MMFGGQAEWQHLVPLADGEGFEPPDPFQGRRFSRPMQSTTLPPIRVGEPDNRLRPVVQAGHNALKLRMKAETFRFLGFRIAPCFYTDPVNQLGLIPPRCVDSSERPVPDCCLPSSRQAV